jgi:Holliday junction DNA helicase RuvA
MIDRIEGQIIGVSETSVFVRGGAAGGVFTFEVLVPVCDIARWRDAQGESHLFYTRAYLESHGQGSSFIPRIIGFACASDRTFFELFTTVKGIGFRKALRAMAMPPGMLATAIAGRDVSMLTTLPEIGKRTAESIIAELHGKVDGFLDRLESAAGASTTFAGRDRTGSVEEGAPAFPSIEVKGGATRLALARDALAVLVQLGENRIVAARWIDRVLTDEPDLNNVEHIVNAAYRFRDG